MASYEFTDEQNKTIGAVGSRLKIAAALLGVLALMALAGGAVATMLALKFQPHIANPKVKEAFVAMEVAAAICLLSTVLQGVFALWNRSAATYFTAITTSRGNDVALLIAALDRLGEIYKLARTAMIVALVVGFTIGFISGALGG